MEGSMKAERERREKLRRLKTQYGEGRKRQKNEPTEPTVVEEPAAPPPSDKEDRFQRILEEEGYRFTNEITVVPVAHAELLADDDDDDFAQDASEDEESPRQRMASPPPPPTAAAQPEVAMAMESEDENEDGESSGRKAEINRIDETLFTSLRVESQQTKDVEKAKEIQEVPDDFFDEAEKSNIGAVNMDEEFSRFQAEIAGEVPTKIAPPLLLQRKMRSDLPPLSEPAPADVAARLQALRLKRQKFRDGSIAASEEQDVELVMTEPAKDRDSEDDADDLLHLDWQAL